MTSVKMTNGAPVREPADRWTTAEAADLYLKANQGDWKNVDHEGQWHRTLVNYINPVIGKIPVADVGTAEVLRVIEILWSTRRETASRYRGRTEAVLDSAHARLRFAWKEDGGNPGRWRDARDQARRVRNPVFIMCSSMAAAKGRPTR